MTCNLNDIDSDFHKKGNGGNVQDISNKSSIPPRHMELNGEYAGEFNDNHNSNTDCVQLSDPHAPRKWKRIEREPPVNGQPSNSQNPSEKKRTCKDGEADLPELQNKKVHVSKAKSSGNFNGGGCRAAPPRRMSLIVWNCRELGTLCTGKELERIVQEKDPSVVFMIRVPGFLAGG